MGKPAKKRYEQTIVDFLNSRPDHIYKARDLAKHLGVSNNDYQAFKRIVRRVAEENKISRHKGNRYGKLRKPSVVEGVLHVKTQGYGFLIRDDGSEDVFISQKNMSTAMHRDRVRVLLWAKPVGKLPEGKVVEVVKRGFQRIVGTFQKARSYNYVTPDDLKLTRDIVIPNQDSQGARTGQKVVVEVTGWGDYRRLPEGCVVEVLGRPDEAGVDVLSIIHTFGLPLSFPSAVEKEVEALSDDFPEELLKNRLDLRDQYLFTIDPVDAKDFDDAVSLEVLPNGNVRLGVHIADVSAFVPVGSAVDREALCRGTSVYLVDRVIPMLPERLSGDLCSLKPGVDRLAYSVLMELTPEGDLEAHDIRESIIRSRRRLTYQDAQIIINSLENDGDSKKISKEKDEALRAALQGMVTLERKLWEKWRRIGSIDFDAPEARVVMDDEGDVVDLRIRERLESHRLVEAFMLLANQTVAEHVRQLRQDRGHPYPFIYRIHERPKGEKLEEFVRFVHALGYPLEIGKRVTPKTFQSLLNTVKGSPHEIMVEQVALRTMMKAVYATRNAGHFGLAFKDYTHFTSPIRRYPDLAVHRLLKSYEKEAYHTPKMTSSLPANCDMATEREIIAQEAEWESIKTKQVAFMEKRLGDIFEGIITGVVPFGIFVEISEYLVEGLVHIKDMEDDYYVHDEKQYCLIGRDKGKVYRLGDSITVRLVRVSREMRKMDFLIEE